MGAISDGSFREVAKYNKDYRAQYTLVHGSGQQVHNPWASLGINLAGSIFTTVLSKIESGTDSTPIDDTSASDPELAASIQEDIDKELEKTGCADISEVKLRLQLAQSGNFDFDSNITSKQEALNTTVSDLTGKYSELNNVTKQLEFAKQEAQYFPDNAPTLDVTELEEQLQDLQKDVRKLEKQQQEQQAELKEAQEKMVQDLQQSLDNLTALQKQLKRVEGRDAIEELTNDKTKNFTSVLKKLQNAIKTGNQEKINKYALELEDAYNDYTEEHPDVQNKTLESGYKLAQQYIDDAKKDNK